MSLKAIIRDAREEDAPELFRIYIESYMEKLRLERPEEMLEYDREKYGQTYAFSSLENFRNKLKHLSERERVLVAEVGGKPVGFVYVKLFKIPRPLPEEDITLGYVEELHVDKHFRKKGLGSELLSASEKWLREKGADLIRLEASEDALGFFLKKGYIPSHLERELYMGKLRYVVMIKLDNSCFSLMGEGITKLVEGDHRKSMSAFEELAEKTKGLTEPLKLMMEYTGFLHSFAYHRLWDEKTWEIANIVRSLGQEAKKYDRFSHFFKAFAMLIKAESLYFFSGNFSTAKQVFSEAAVEIEEGLSEIRDDPVFKYPPFDVVKRFFECQALWARCYALVASLLEELLKSGGGKCLEANLPQVDICNGIGALVRDVRALMSYITDILENVEAINKRLSIKLSGTLFFYDYFSMDMTIERKEIKRFSERLLSHVASLIGGSVLKATRPFLSDDVVADVLRERIHNIAELILRASLITHVLDQKITLDGHVKLMAMPNGDFIIEYAFRFDDMPLLALYYLMKAYEPSMREHTWLKLYETGSVLPLKDFRGELIEALKSMVVDVRIRELGEETFYTMILIDDIMVDGSKHVDASYYEEIAYSLASPLTSLSLGPIDWIYKEGELVQNLAPLLSEQGFITVGERYAVLLLPDTEDWIAREITGLLLLMAYHKFMTSKINRYIDEEAMRFKEVPLSVKEVDEAIKRLSSRALRDLWVYWSPSLISHPEYQAFVKEAEKLMGLDEDIERLDERLLWLETLVSLELKARSMISEEDRALLRQLGHEIALIDIHAVSDPLIEVQPDKDITNIKVGDIFRLSFRIYNPNPTALLILKKICGLLDRDYLELVEPRDAVVEGEDLILNKTLRQYREEHVKVKLKAIRAGEFKLNISLLYKIKGEERSKPVCTYYMRISPS